MALTHTGASVQCWYLTPCYLKPIYGSFLVKPGFKNNPVIGMSAMLLE